MDMIKTHCIMDVKFIFCYVFLERINKRNTTVTVKLKPRINYTVQ